ncbi:unnamed protein product [Toxocara canis]|uniref:Secreted protein n=1 Tax=Toxocara canis TaxID=6265 RepID=A0A183V9P8_TOXCA|nr:unnamed protein product [Toxocara canis]
MRVAWHRRMACIDVCSMHGILTLTARNADLTIGNGERRREGRRNDEVECRGRRQAQTDLCMQIRTYVCRKGRLDKNAKQRQRQTKKRYSD